MWCNHFVIIDFESRSSLLLLLMMNDFSLKLMVGPGSGKYTHGRQAGEGSIELGKLIQASSVATVAASAS